MFLWKKMLKILKIRALLSHMISAPKMALSCWAIEQPIHFDRFFKNIVLDDLFDGGGWIEFHEEYLAAAEK